MPYDFVKQHHPIHDAHVDEWTRRERLLDGGVDVIEEELERFEWEEENGTHYTNRKRQAVYPGFGEAFVRTMVGHVLRDRPEPGEGLFFGGLGEVQRTEGQTQPSRAEQVFYNVNGTGGDGQQFWQWIAAVFQRAGATGIRWLLVEAPPWRGGDRQPSVADELRGFRPYAVEFSPRSVTNWRIENGVLQWCVIQITNDTRRVVNGQMAGKFDEPGFYLLVRAGVTELGAEFKGGGWWKLNENAELIPNASGTWSKTGGEIPMSFAIWEHANPAPPADGADPKPLARGGTTALDNLSVAYMNAKSAWRSNMWRAAGGPTFLMGVDSDTWKIAREQWMEGNSLIGVPVARDGSTPQIAHSGAAAVTAESFKALLEDMTAEAERMMIQMATSTPDSSGRSKEAGFAETKAPRLTLLAENIESCVNTLLRFFELRYGVAQPGAYVVMPREFDLAPVEEDIREFFETFSLSELRAPTLESKAMVALAEAKGLVSDEDREAIEAELLESAKDGATSKQQEEAQGDEIDRVLAGTAAEGNA